MTTPQMIYKTHHGGDAGSNGLDLAGANGELPFSEEQIDIISRAMAMSQRETDDEIARLAGELQATREAVAQPSRRACRT
jgi:hypothetical protein